MIEASSETTSFSDNLLFCESAEIGVITFGRTELERFLKKIKLTKINIKRIPAMQEKIITDFFDFIYKIYIIFAIKTTEFYFVLNYFTSKKNESLLQQLIHYEYYRKIEPLTIPLEFDLILNV